MLELQWGLNSFLKQISGYGVARIMLFENCRYLQGLKKNYMPRFMSCREKCMAIERAYHDYSNRFFMTFLSVSENKVL